MHKITVIALSTSKTKPKKRYVGNKYGLCVFLGGLLKYVLQMCSFRYPSLEPLLWQQLIYDPDRRAGSVLSLITVAALVGEFSISDSHSQAAYFQQAFPVILPWVLTPHVTVGHLR